VLYVCCTWWRNADENTSDCEAELEENRRLREARTCKVCMDREVNTVFLPCGHLVCCDTCSPALRNCAVCRALIRGTVKVFLGWSLRTVVPPSLGVRRNFCRSDKVQPSISWLLWLSRAVLTDAEAPYWHLQSVTDFQLNSTCTGTVNLRYRWIHSVILVSVKCILHEVVFQFQSRHC